MAKTLSFKVVMSTIVIIIAMSVSVVVYKSNKESQLLMDNFEIMSENLGKMSDIQLKLVESEIFKIRQKRETINSQINS